MHRPEKMLFVYFNIPYIQPESLYKKLSHMLHISHLTFLFAAVDTVVVHRPRTTVAAVATRTHDLAHDHTRHVSTDLTVFISSSIHF